MPSKVIPSRPPKPAARPVIAQTLQPATAGFNYNREGSGWDRVGLDPNATAHEVALNAKSNEPEIVRGTEDTSTWRDQAHALMSERGQAIDPKDKDYLSHYRDALQEASQ